MKVVSLQEERKLYASLYVSCQSREGDLTDFFAHENHAYPPSISEYGKLRKGTKADFLACIEEKDIIAEENEVNASAKIIDGAAMVQMLKPIHAKTFGDYSTEFLKAILRQMCNKLQRVDIVFHRYIQGSLKSETRESRGSGVRILVNEATPIWKNWQQFLRNDDNKTELFKLLASSLTSSPVLNGVIVVTESENVFSSEDVDLSMLEACNHEEADTRVFLHAKQAAQAGHRKIVIKTVDTDVVVIAISLFRSLQIDELWIEFGVGKSRRRLPIHKYAQDLGQNTCSGLRFWYAFTGCDTVSSFFAKGKKTAWKTWTVYPEVTDTFIRLSDAANCQLRNSDVRMIERYVVLMYQRTSSNSNVNECRRELFTKNGCSSENLPPTRDALIQHIRRAIYQAAFVWGQSLDCMQNLPDANEWGWRISNGDVHPLWMTLPEASKACRELVKCGCKKKCATRCKCRQFHLDCTELCACNGQCNCIWQHNILLFK